MIRPVRRSHGLRRRRRHHATRRATAGTPAAWRRVRLGPRQAAGGPTLGAAPHGIDLAACHACSDSVFDLPLLSSVGWPHAVNPDAGLTVVAAARRWPIEYWDRPSGVPSLVGLEPYHLLRPFVRPESFPYARFDIDGVEHVPAAGRCWWRPTTAATSTWPHWPSWPPASAGRCGSSASGSCSTPRCSGGWPGPSAASRSTGAADRTSRCVTPPPRSGPVRWSSSCPRGPSRGAPRSSTRCCTAGPVRPGWPRRPVRRWCPWDCGAPSRCGPARPGALRSPECSTPRRCGSGWVSR